MIEKLIYKIAMIRGKKYIVGRYSLEFYQNFKRISKDKMNQVSPCIPKIGKSIFSLNYKYAPAYIAWYLTLKELNVPQKDIDEIIWKSNEAIMTIIPSSFMHAVGNKYFSSFRQKAALHMKRQKEGKLHPYDWEIEYRSIDSNCFEIDIYSCGFKKLAKDFGAEGLLPGICRMDYLYAYLMKNGFERTKTLGDGDECCNCRYYIKGDCDWSPEKGFNDRK